MRIGHWDPVTRTDTSGPDASGEYRGDADGIVLSPMAGASNASPLEAPGFFASVADGWLSVPSGRVTPNPVQQAVAAHGAALRLITFDPADRGRPVTRPPHYPARRS